MKRAVIITGPGFEDVEVTYPFYRLQEAGFSVEIATKGKATVTGKHGYPIAATMDAVDVRADDFDLFVIPGGHEAPDRVRQIPEVLAAIHDANDKKKVIASLCHGPWVLISAGIMRGRSGTCYKGCKDDLINAGANYIDTDVVVDKNLVTSPHFRDMPAWMRETIALFK